MGEKEEMKMLIQEVFEHYGKDKIEQEDFMRYFQSKGMTKQEVDDLWCKADSMKLIKIGVIPISEPDNPLKILGHKVIFSIYERED